MGIHRSVDPTVTTASRPGGRPRIDDRAALEGILFVLHTGCRWRDLPQASGYRPGHTARRRPEKLNADEGCDYPRCRSHLPRRGTKVRTARRGIEDKTHPGRHRRVVERTISWPVCCKCLGIRDDPIEATLVPLLLQAATLIHLRRLHQDPTA